MTINEPEIISKLYKIIDIILEIKYENLRKIVNCHEYMIDEVDSVIEDLENILTNVCGLISNLSEEKYEQK